MVEIIKEKTIPFKNMILETCKLKKYWVNAILPLYPMSITTMLRLRGNLIVYKKVAFGDLMMNDYQRFSISRKLKLGPQW
jgi:hypothetical protein